MPSKPRWPRLIVKDRNTIEATLGDHGVVTITLETDDNRFNTVLRLRSRPLDNTEVRGVLSIEPEVANAVTVRII